MTGRENVVVAVLAAGGGSLTSRVRFQKTVYLLDRLGFGSGLDFEYHHYGPYSRQLDHAIGDAEAIGKIEEDRINRQSDGVMYSVFKLKDRSQLRAGAFGNLGDDQAAQVVQAFARTNITVLELAATIDWLVHRESFRDWRNEVVRRKGAKVENGRLEKAMALLDHIGLPPPAAAAV